MLKSPETALRKWFNLLILSHGNIFLVWGWWDWESRNMSPLEFEIIAEDYAIFKI